MMETRRRIAGMLLLVVLVMLMMIVMLRMVLMMGMMSDIMLGRETG
jgi:hypothetical protein